MRKLTLAMIFTILINMTACNAGKVDTAQNKTDSVNKAENVNNINFNSSDPSTSSTDLRASSMLTTNEPDYFYLVGDWDGDKRSNIAVRRGGIIHMDTNFDSDFDQSRPYGNPGLVSEYLVGDWNGDGKDDFAVRGKEDKANLIQMETATNPGNFREFRMGNPGAVNQWLVGNWDGVGGDNIAVRMNDVILMDTDFNSNNGHEIRMQWGKGNSEDQYLVGDWDGDGRDNIAVRRGSKILMDTNFAPGHEMEFDYGNPGQGDTYLAGNWDGIRGDNIAFKSGNKILMDYNWISGHELEQIIGNGPNPKPPGACEGSLEQFEATSMEYLQDGILLKNICTGLQRKVSTGKFCRSTPFGKCRKIDKEYDVSIYQYKQ